MTWINRQPEQIFAEDVQYIAAHLPGVQFEAFPDQFLLVAIHQGQEYRITYDRDALAQPYQALGRQFFTIQCVMMALYLETGEAMHFDSSVVDNALALTPPFSGLPFRMKRRVGNQVQIHFIGNPSFQAGMVQTFSRYECNQALCFHHTHQLDLRVYAALLERLSQLSTPSTQRRLAYKPYAKKRTLPEVNRHA